MIITNKFNLPDAIYNVISKDNYKKGKAGYSVTEVINSPRIVQLSRKFSDEITEDATDRIWSVFGSAVHHLLETHASEEGFSEQRYYVDVLGRVIGGQIDAYNNKTITDYKVTSVYSLMGNKKDDWEKQQNMYAYILLKNGIEVEKLQIACFLRDWSKSNALRGDSYPRLPFMIIPLRLWGTSEQEDYLYDRVRVLIENEDNITYLCSREDTWEKPPVFAITKRGATRATKLSSSMDEAKMYIQGLSGSKEFEIIERKGELTRCESYCACKNVCEQYKTIKGE